MKTRFSTSTETETETETESYRELVPFCQTLAESLVEKLIPLIESQLFETKVECEALTSAVRESLPAHLRDTFTAHFFGGTLSARENRAHFIHLLSAAKLESMGHMPFLPSDTLPTSDKDRDLTSTEAAKLLHVSRGQINLLAESGALGEVRKTVGGHRRISLNGAITYLRSSKVHR
jgi:excisionase family DNA binding protein